MIVKYINFFFIIIDFIINCNVTYFLLVLISIIRLYACIYPYTILHHYTISLRAMIINALKLHLTVINQLCRWDYFIHLTLSARKPSLYGITYKDGSRTERIRIFITTVYHTIGIEMNSKKYIYDDLKLKKPSGLHGLNTIIQRSKG